MAINFLKLVAGNRCVRCAVAVCIQYFHTKSIMPSAQSATAFLGEAICCQLLLQSEIDRVQSCDHNTHKQRTHSHRCKRYRKRNTHQLQLYLSVQSHRNRYKFHHRLANPIFGQMATATATRNNSIIKMHMQIIYLNNSIVGVHFGWLLNKISENSIVMLLPVANGRRRCRIKPNTPLTQNWLYFYQP